MPAGHTLGSVAQQAELPTLNRGRAGSKPAGVTFGRTATGAVSRLEKTGARSWGNLPVPPDPLHRSASRTSAPRFPLLPLSFRCSRAVRRATVNREAQVRALPPELHAPVVEWEMTPDSQSGSCGFESRRGCFAGLCHRRMAQGSDATTADAEAVRGPYRASGVAQGS